MSERNFAFLACPADLENPGPAVDWLPRSEDKDRKDSSLFVAVNTKFSAPKGIRTFNMGVNYPSELAQLATHANYARGGQPPLRQYHDAQALLCIHRFVEAHPDISHIVLVTEKPGDDDDPVDVLRPLPSKPFHRIQPVQEKAAAGHNSPVIFDRSSPDFDGALKLALDVALTGAIYGLVPYSLAGLLEQATSAASIISAQPRLEKVD